MEVPQVLAFTRNWPVAFTGPIGTSTVPGLMLSNDFSLLCLPTTVSPKFHDDGMIITGGGTTPLPERVMALGLPAALSQIMSVAEELDTMVGANDAVIEHEAPGA